MPTSLEYYYQIERLKQSLNSPDYEPLTTRQQQALAIRANDQGDDKARNRLVCSVLRYNFELAKELADKYNKGNVQDLYSRGVVHIWESSFKYDPKYETNSNFLTYVKKLLKVKIMDAIQRDHTIAQGGGSVWGKHETEIKDYDQNGYPVYFTDLRNFAEVTRTSSLDSPAYSNIGEDLEDSNEVDEIYMHKEKRKVFYDLFMKELTPMQKDILNATSGGITEKGLKLKDLAIVYGKTAECLRLIGKKAEQNLKTKMLAIYQE